MLHHYVMHLTFHSVTAIVYSHFCLIISLFLLQTLLSLHVTLSPSWTCPSPSVILCPRITRSPPLRFVCDCDVISAPPYGCCVSLTSVCVSLSLVLPLYSLFFILYSYIQTLFHQLVALYRASILIIFSIQIKSI